MFFQLNSVFYENNTLQTLLKGGKTAYTNRDLKHRCMAAKSFGASETDLRPTKIQDQQIFESFFCPISLKS